MKLPQDPTQNQPSIQNQPPAHSNHAPSDLMSKWSLVSVQGRVDAFSEKNFFRQISELKEKSVLYYALSMKDCQFMSLNAFRFLVATTTEIRAFGGDLVLLAPSLAIQKQIDTFIGPHFFQSFQNEDELVFKTVLYPDWFRTSK